MGKHIQKCKAPSRPSRTSERVHKSPYKTLQGESCTCEKGARLYRPTFYNMKLTILSLLLVGVFTPTVAHEAETVNEPSHYEVKAYKVVRSIEHVETGGKDIPGKSGETGVLQMKPSTFKNLSLKHLGTTTPNTSDNQRKVALLTFKDLLEDGHDVDDIARYWNAGSVDPNRCRKGVNRYGVPYDCPAYVKKVLSTYQNM